MLDRLKLSAKIAILVAASLIGLLLEVAYSASSMRTAMLDARKLQIR